MRTLNTTSGRWVVLGTLAAGACLLACSTAPLPTCPELTGWSAPGVEILTAEEIAAEDPAPAYCKVAGTADGTIQFELLLPADWNGKLLMGGGGGFVGSIDNQALQVVPRILERGYATVGTDTGHQGSSIDATWALNDPEAEENFAHLAVHRTAETAKAIVRDFYGKPSHYDYFLGCSRGGGQAMISAQRYPDDFDGIVAVAPAQDWPGIGADFVQNMQAVYPEPDDLRSPVITAENRALLSREILARCDAYDGLADGILTDPRRCDFDPGDLPRCTADPGVDCVTDRQLEAIRTVYRGAMVDGVEVFPGLPFGGENDPGGWDQWVTGGPNAFGPGTPSLHYAFGTQMYKFLIFDDPEWNYATYDFTDWHAETARMAQLLNSTDPDLSAFGRSGGKLIMGHGWSDSALTALFATDYYESVEAQDGDLRDYYRLFMMPGVLHCAGGPGADTVEWIASLEQWVEHGNAPEQLVASKIGNREEVLFTRPLCPYPQVAIYDGDGDPSEATSFRCGAPPA
jgi:hypothetical protein